MKTIFYVIALIVLATSFFGCTKKRGCNIPDACNYDSSAEKNDGSCEYEKTWFKDDDGDGAGDPGLSVVGCDQPEGYVDNADGAIGSPAVNFRSIDCDGVEHDLFTELDNNTIVVIAWVMPCSSCITDPLATFNIVNDYGVTHPGRVVFYLVDDYGDDNCANLGGWANFYGLGNATKFSDDTIKMSDYGDVGMPKIIVLGGANHQVYFDKHRSHDGVKDAIDKALSDNPM